MPDIEWNKKVWDQDYPWPKDGDEWDESAKFCKVPYDKWKAQLIAAFATPHIRPETVMLEIGPGHGRWSEFFAPKVSALHLVDLSPSCIEFCKSRLAGFTNVKYHVNDGKSLADIKNASVDFVWSFDTFVHIEEPEIRAYAKELRRVMKPQAIGVIHHPGSPTPDQRKNGMRSMMDRGKMLRILGDNALYLIRQTDSWGEGCNTRFAGDMISVFARP